MIEESSQFADFPGTARLFPLPNLVLFPHVVQPLHIFEPRYRQMTADALADDRTLAICLLKPGWEGSYEGAPAVHPVACLARMISSDRLEDGRYNLMVRGVHRIRILDELPHEKLYRTARVELLPEPSPPTAAFSEDCRRSLERHVESWNFWDEKVVGHFRQLVASDLGVGTILDILAFALPFPVAEKQELLADLDLAARSDRLLRCLDQLRPTLATTGGKRFPPDFSSN